MTESKLEKIKILILDADGVLTRGEIIYTGTGPESKAFNVKDGFGIRMLKDAGIMVGVITGRHSEAIERRAKELGLDFCRQGVKDKSSLLAALLEQAGCGPEEAAFVGDDIPDIAVMKRAGLGIAVADAHEAVRECADMVTANSGGNGAVREVCERILKAKGLWEGILKSWA